MQETISYRPSGSSPQMRGALFWTGPGTQERRIIPADAGSTLSVADHTSYCKDHPRRCGEHALKFMYNFNTEGSSPQMRGAHQRLHDRVHDHGIIPADAGSTGLSCLLSGYLRDHPRRCGEHQASNSRVSSVLGSSPQMRGAHVQGFSGFDGQGIIPADAGSTHL